MRIATLLLTIATAINSQAGQAEPAGPGSTASERLFRFPADPPAAGGCLKPAGDTRIVALGAYEAKMPVSFFAPSASSDAGVIAINGEKSGPPIILVLSAYDPVIWDLRKVPKGRVQGVIVYGYHAQAVVGVPAKVSVRFSTQTQPLWRCGLAYAYEGGRNLEKLDLTVREATGRSINQFDGGYAPLGFNFDGGAPPTPDVDSITLGMIEGSEPFSVSAVPPKAAGVAALLKQGAIRRVTAQDQVDLNVALTKASATGHLAPVRMALDPRAYVILEAITIPRFMYGGYSGTFLVAKGVPSPDDPGSHNSYIRLDDGSCLRGTPLRANKCFFGGS